VSGSERPDSQGVSPAAGERIGDTLEAKPERIRGRTIQAGDGDHLHLGEAVAEHGGKRAGTGVHRGAPAQVLAPAAALGHQLRHPHTRDQPQSHGQDYRQVRGWTEELGHHPTQESLGGEVHACGHGRAEGCGAQFGGDIVNLGRQGLPALVRKVKCQSEEAAQYLNREETE